MGLEIIITLAIALGLPGAAGITVAYSAWRERQPKALSWKERRAVAATKRTQKKQAKLKAVEDARKAQQAEIEAEREKSRKEVQAIVEANRPKALLAAWDEEFKALAEPAITTVEYTEIKSGRKDAYLEMGEAMAKVRAIGSSPVRGDPCRCSDCQELARMPKPVKYKSDRGHVPSECSCADCNLESYNMLTQLIADLDNLS